MADTVTRTFKTVNVCAYTLDVDGDGNPIKNVIFEGEMFVTTPNTRMMRRAVSDALDGARLPNGTRISFDIVGEQTYSMTLDDFIEHATLISE